MQSGVLHIQKLSESYREFEIEFTPAFETTPILLLSDYGRYPGPQGFYTAFYVSTTGARIYVKNNEINDTYSYDIQWVAISK